MYRDVNQELNEFTGTQSHYRVRDYFYTDGINYLMDKYECQWLVSDIFIFILSTPKLKDENFLLWKLQRQMMTDKNTGAVLERTETFILSCEDGNGNVLFAKGIPFSDFKGDSLKLYFENDVLYLPSER